MSNQTFPRRAQGGARHKRTRRGGRAHKPAMPYVALPYDTKAADLAVLQKAIGYRFHHKELLLRALTHASYTHEHTEVQSYERLEFLGDRILSFVVDKFLFDTHPDLMEGDLTKLHSMVVANETLAEYATELGLGTHLRYARGTQVVGTKIPADLFEALLAAIYLDRGKLCYPERLILRFVKPKVEALRKEIDWEHLVRDVEKNARKKS